MVHHDRYKRVPSTLRRSFQAGHSLSALPTLGGHACTEDDCVPLQWHRRDEENEMNGISCYWADTTSRVSVCRERGKHEW